MPTSPSVLTVDSSAESREVLQALLEYQGINTVEASNINEAVKLLGDAEADVVIIDFDSIQIDEKEQLLPLWHKSALSDTPIVILGTNRPTIPADLVSDFVRKPYHYQQLLNKILGHLGDIPQEQDRQIKKFDLNYFDTAIPRKAA